MPSSWPPVGRSFWPLTDWDHPTSRGTSAVVLAKGSLASVLLLSFGLLAIPLVIGGSGSQAVGGCGGDVSVILDTIRTLESGGRYDVPKNAGGASGAYQYIDSTWNSYGGYTSAYLAPHEVQDERAAIDVQQVLDTYGDVGYVPISWYWPRAIDHPEDLDIVPKPSAGNRLTVREYQTRWLELYHQKLTAALGAPSTTAGSTTSTASPSPTLALAPSATVLPANACDGATDVGVDGYALPIPRSIIDTNPAMLNAPHHDYPAIDLMVPVGTPVYAVRGGTVARVVNWPYNCWTIGRCDETCGVGISINGDDGGRWIYCHGSRLNVVLGTQVAAGQVIMWSGDTGRSGAPHLHLEIRVENVRRCPQALLRGIFVSGQTPRLDDLVPSGCVL